jgi:hypothetical protein
MNAIYPNRTVASVWPPLITPHEFGGVSASGISLARNFVEKQVELTDRIPCGEIESLSKEPGRRAFAAAWRWNTPLPYGDVHAEFFICLPGPVPKQDNFSKPFRPVSDYLKLVKTSRAPQNVALFAVVMLHFLFAHFISSR